MHPSASHLSPSLCLSLTLFSPILSPSADLGVAASRDTYSDDTTGAGVTHQPSVHCNHAKQVAEGPCAAENPLSNGRVRDDSAFCANYAATCSSQPGYAPYDDCEATLAGNAGGMTW